MRTDRPIRVMAGHVPARCVVAGPSGRAYGPPKGMLGPVIHDFDFPRTPPGNGFPLSPRPPSPN
jgi:hypothetical protein